MVAPEKIIAALEAKAEKLRRAAFAVKPQPSSPFGTCYGGFQRRMLAATLDSVVITFTIFPLSFWFADMLLGKVDMNFLPMVEQLQYVTDPAVRAHIISEFLHDGGRFRYFFYNSLIQLIGMMAYCMFFWTRYGATPGKMLTRLEVVHLETGKYLSTEQGFWRCVGYMLGSLPLFLGIFWMAWDKKRQGLHDKMVGSVVIVKRRTLDPAIKQDDTPRR